MKYHYLLPHFFLDTCDFYQNKTALVFDNQTYTFGKIASDVRKLASYFHDNRLSVNDRVVIQTGNVYFTIICFWATLMNDGVACIIDPDYSAEIFCKITESLSPAFCFTSLDENWFQENLTDYSDQFYFNSLKNENDLAIIMHTSGSTGTPKGVMLSHRNVLAALQSISHYLELTEHDVILSVLPLHFDYGLYQILFSFYHGLLLILEKNALFPQRWVNKMNQQNISVLPCVPSIIQLIDNVCVQKEVMFQSLRCITNTGERITEKHIALCQRVFPNAKIFSMFGLTECKRCSFVPPRDLQKKCQSIGIPMPNLSMWIEDENGNRLGAHQEGELVVSGPTVMLGYWKNESETLKKIKEDFIGNKILKTGDFALMDDDGFFYFLGRGDFTIKWKGAKLSLNEMLRKITVLNSVNRAHIFLHESQDQEKQLMVCIESDIAQDDCFTREILSIFPAIQKPSYVYVTPRFPALSNGKINKLETEARAIASA
ncbi:MAG: long chain acyl-CoA synthetase [uncultured bacterium]|nr:MAG: long chain acyl-CoA synthetase [uncultured bacterium]OGT26798.1 MAG: hypothetical protein A3B71_04135 [Gammaproteobacteria bacterium RIFCSPHIGHO2_02_FULL_42_43]OGT52895.1 MAG: hypothetical protein A3E54_07390 [Gammaproteobacteria bacterium RIFCSPHIGHO2_12_FULL_41_25]OGT61332.1 MAG: hypothetical protein A3I77_08300 [Gammaproteobacteria bacterium RIFCSPLOWO2_02_FULL_42_14]OGT87261.1 MAG: hypothetical protein A3G86_02025 [Gammaproteobacteria bacterium RIFCSPLOWO2_12_FULL_42_18]